jgi:hypothetical protein
MSFLVGKVHRRSKSKFRPGCERFAASSIRAVVGYVPDDGLAHAPESSARCLRPRPGRSSKIFCFEVDGRYLSEIIEIGSQPFVGPLAAHFMKMAQKIPVVVKRLDPGNSRITSSASIT